MFEPSCMTSCGGRTKASNPPKSEAVPPASFRRLVARFKLSWASSNSWLAALRLALRPEFCSINSRKRPTMPTSRMRVPGSAPVFPSRERLSSIASVFDARSLLRLGRSFIASSCADFRSSTVAICSRKSRMASSVTMRFSSVSRLFTASRAVSKRVENAASCRSSSGSSASQPSGGSARPPNSEI